MSVEKVHRQRGAVWRVRWRDDLGRPRSKVLGTKRDAEAFDAEVRRRKRTGELASMDAGKETLAKFAEEWWRLYAVTNLAPKTLKVYADLWDLYVLPRLGGYPLRNLTPEVLARFRADLAAADVGDPTIRKLMSIVQGVLQRAVEWHRLTTNPARAVRKPAQKRMMSRLLRWRSNGCALDSDRTDAYAMRPSSASWHTPDFGRVRRLRSSGSTWVNGRSL